MPGFLTTSVLDHTVALDPRTVGDQSRQLREQLLDQQARSTRSGAVAQAFHTSLVEAMNPIPKRLPVHSSGAGDLLTADAIEHRRQRQKPTGDPTVPLKAGLARNVLASMSRRIATATIMSLRKSPR
jgi:hypothetical protein